MENKETREKVAESFNKNIGTKAKITAKERDDKIAFDKKQAEDLVAYFVNVLATAVIEVTIPNPRRKRDNWARRGHITSLITNFHTRRMMAKVVYDHGLEIKVNGKKEFLPYTDMYNLDELIIVKLVDRTPKEDEDEDEKKRESD